MSRDLAIAVVLSVGCICFTFIGCFVCYLAYKAAKKDEQ